MTHAPTQMPSLAEFLRSSHPAAVEWRKAKASLPGVEAYEVAWRQAKCPAKP